MAKSPNWSEKELQILREKYPQLGKCEELKNLFPGRTLEGITLKANRIGLRVINNSHKRRTHKEYVELLKDSNFEVLESYAGGTTPILHKCKLCGHLWNTRPQHALREGAQCPICSLNTRTNNIDYIIEVLDKARMYMHSDYLGALKPITLEHLDCGYVWETKFSYIQQGSGCPLCNRGFGYSLSKDQMPGKAKLYLLKVTTSEEVFLKVGVTIREVSARLREFKSSFIKEHPTIEILKVWESSGIEVLKKEQHILNKFKSYITSLSCSGFTELLHIEDLSSIIREFE